MLGRQTVPGRTGAAAPPTPPDTHPGAGEFGTAPSESEASSDGHHRLVQVLYRSEQLSNDFAVAV